MCEQGLAMLGVGGELYLVGVANSRCWDRPEHRERDRQAEAHSRREFRLNECQARYPDVRGAVPARRINLDDLVSKKISLREANDGYAALKNGSLTRVVVTSF